MANKTVLVTGATGFLGRQVVKAFAFHDWTVKGTGFSRADGVNILKVDLANPAEVEAVLDQQKCVPHYHRSPNAAHANTIPGTTKDPKS